MLQELIITPISVANGLTRCGDRCVDLQTDLNHCGMCAKQCPTTCVLGICGLTCDDHPYGCPVNTICFDNLGPGYIPSYYASLNWNNLIVADGNNFPGTGFQHGIISPPNIIFNNGNTPGIISSSSTFTIISAYATAQRIIGDSAIFQAFQGATQVG